jgi:hypothetical protein
LEELEDIITIGVDKVKDFFTVGDVGNFEAKPMVIHLCMFKVFLLYLMRKGQASSTTFNEDDVLDMKKTKFKKYCGSANYHADIAPFCSPVMTVTRPRIDTYADEVVHTMDLLTVKEFQQRVERNKNHYVDLKDDKAFINWNDNSVATAHKYYMDDVLDKTNIPILASDQGKADLLVCCS